MQRCRWRLRRRSGTGCAGRRHTTAVALGCRLQQPVRCLGRLCCGQPHEGAVYTPLVHQPRATSTSTPPRAPVNVSDRWISLLLLRSRMRAPNSKMKRICENDIVHAHVSGLPVFAIEVRTLKALTSDRVRTVDSRSSVPGSGSASDCYRGQRPGAKCTIAHT